MSELPCEICGPENVCSCPPCPCVWCRYRRGEATRQERAMVDAHTAAHDAADARRYGRESAARMRENINRLLGDHP